jgi:hypothetical protein
MRQYLKIGELKKLLDGLPEYYEDMPVQAVFGNNRLDVVSVEAVERNETTKLVSNALHLKVEIPKVTKKAKKEA